MSDTPEWTEDRVEDLLQHPHRLVGADPWRSRIAAAGGLAALYEQLRQFPLKDKQAAVLRVLLDQPGAGVAAYTALLHIHPTTFARQQRALIQHLVLLLNAQGSEPGAAASAVAVPRQLRPPVSDFVGRAAELAQIAQALSGARHVPAAALAAIHGMGGAGKSELAQLAAHRLRDQFPDGQLVLDLRGAGAAPLAPELALQTAIRALTGQDKLPAELPALEDLYRSALAGKRVLILADDARDAAHARPLVPPVGNALLVTTRQRWTLPGMASVQLDSLPPAEAAALLREISGRLDEAAADQIAAAVGCLPLALRVAGALLRNNPALTAARYVDRLAAADRRLGALRDPDDPQLNVEAALSLSYDALPAPAQAALRQLGALVADFDSGLGLALIGQGDAGEEQLHALLRRNLVRYDPASARWRLHDLIRSMALRKLIDASEHDAAQWRYADAVQEILKDNIQGNLSGAIISPQQVAQFDQERPHLNALWDWVSRHPGAERADLAIISFVLHTTGIGTWRYNRTLERLRQYEAALAAAERLQHTQYQIQIHSGLGSTHLRAGRFSQAIEHYQTALSLSRATSDDKKYEAIIIRNIATAYSMLQGGENLETAIVLHLQALEIFKDLDLIDQVGISLNNIGIAHIQNEDYLKGIEVLNELMEIAAQHNFDELSRFAVNNIAEAHINLGDFHTALPLLEKSYQENKDLGILSNQAYVLIGLGRTYAALDRKDDAFTAFESGLEILRAIDNQWGEADCAWHYGLALIRYGHIEPALPHLRAAVAYEQVVNHGKTAEHQALIARLEAGETPTPEELAAASH